MTPIDERVSKLREEFHNAVLSGDMTEAYAIHRAMKGANWSRPEEKTKLRIAIVAWYISGMAFMAALATQSSCPWLLMAVWAIIMVPVAVVCAHVCRG